ncbi:cuticle protein 8-like [Panulirus ornatus]|uniref:cuticle protein 8-like n=1 Tax=Panulirus ornatus TaxID=150431 RepID=UPI003A883771
MAHKFDVLQIFVLAALVALASADILPNYITPLLSYNPPPPSYSAPQPVGPAQYTFNWNVKDDYAGNDYGHEETRNGYDTYGSYYALLPDGRFQKVDYTVNGDSGFLAQVQYDGEAQYPIYQPGPTYQPPPTYT